MHAPGIRFRRILTFGAVPTAMVLTAGIVWHASYSAFSSDTRNSGNSWSTGVVALTDDDNGSARFSVTNLVPAETDTKCIKVTATSSVASTVKLYILNAVPSAQGLENHLKVTVTAGDGGTFASCAGFVASGGPIIATQTLAAATAVYSDYATGAGSWATSGTGSPEVKTYEITWLFDTTGMTQEQLDGLQGARTGLDFEWEMQNN